MKKWIFLILLLAFALRVIGIDYGLPLFLVGDEVSLTGGALRMMELQTFIPVLHPEEFRLLYYPPLISYLYLVFIIPIVAAKYFILGSDLNLLKQNIILHPSLIWMVTRFVTAALGTLTVYLAYIGGKKIFNNVAGVFAGLFVASSFFAVQLSHFARHWAPATFFTYLTVMLGLLIFQKPDRKTYLWAGLMAGIAFGASYITAIAVVVVLLAHFLSLPEKKQSVDESDPLFAKSLHVDPSRKTDKRLPDSFWRRLVHPNLWSFVAVFVAVSAVFAWLNYPEFHRIVFGEDSTLAVAKSLSGLVSALQFSITSFFLLEPVLVVCAGIGLIYLFVINRRLGILFLTFPLVYWIVLYFFFHFEPRYNLLLVPWLAILAATFLMELWELKFLSGVIRFAVILLVVLPFVVSGYYNWLLVKEDTRNEAVEWIESNVGEHSRIAMYAANLELLPDRQAIQTINNQYPYLKRSKHQVLEEIADRDYPQPSYDYLNLRELDQNDLVSELQSVSSGKYEYLIVEYFDDEDLPSEIQKMVFEEEDIVFMSRLDNEEMLNIHGNFHEPIWKIFKLDRLGPQVKVIRL